MGLEPQDVWGNFLLILTENMLVSLCRERGRGERDSDVREKHLSVPSHVCPDWGSSPRRFWCAGRCFDQLRHLARPGNNYCTYSSEVLYESPSFSIRFLYWKDRRVTGTHTWNYNLFQRNLAEWAWFQPARQGLKDIGKHWVEAKRWP